MSRTFAEMATDASTTTDKLAPGHPGEIPMEDFIEGSGSPRVELDALSDSLDSIQPLRTA